MNNELIEKEIIKIFPNPSSGKVHIENLGENFRIEVYSSTGRLVAQEHGSSQGAFIDLESQPDGVYFVHVFDRESYSLSRRIVKSN